MVSTVALPIARETGRRAPKRAAGSLVFADEQPAYFQVKLRTLFFFVLRFQVQSDASSCRLEELQPSQAQPTVPRMRQVCRRDNEDGFM